jgi:hypothetical protein
VGVQYIYLPLKKVYHGAVINSSPRHIRKQNQHSKKGKLVGKKGVEKTVRTSERSIFPDIGQALMNTM